MTPATTDRENETPSGMLALAAGIRTYRLRLGADTTPEAIITKRYIMPGATNSVMCRQVDSMPRL